MIRRPLRKFKNNEDNDDDDDQHPQEDDAAADDPLESDPPKALPNFIPNLLVADEEYS